VCHRTAFCPTQAGLVNEEQQRITTCAVSVQHVQGKT